jgi:protoporphyrinogen oxidase
MDESASNSVAIIGAGPAGLAAGYALAKAGVPVTILEADAWHVGGISRTAEYKGFLFDIGGHRFFSKSQEVEDFWTEILPDDMLQRPRSSRIYYGGQFFTYPLRGTEALFKLGPVEAARCLASYVKARLFPAPNPRTFEEWVSNQFGRRLYEIFFKTYTEKVWGMSCRDISADWAAQRIKGLSLAEAIRSALAPRRAKPRSDVVKTLIDSFRYPRRGPGMLWEACAARIERAGGHILRGHRTERARWDGAGGLWTVAFRNGSGPGTLTARHLVSSAPLRDLAAMLEPRLSPAALSAASSLRYRDFLTVVLILLDRGRFDDNWIYVHSPEVKMGRIQNFKSWSPEMVPDPAYCSYGLEYFCFEGDELWKTPDAALVELGKRELAQVGLARADDVVDGCVVRQRKAYPVYDDGYAERVDTMRRELEASFRTLHLVGRNGMHRYNNQDHAIMTGMLTARNILAGRRVFDPWRVNEDAEYHEAVRADDSSPLAHEAPGGERSQTAARRWTAGDKGA